ncbi:putative toluenesulfonate zinc-independent alcohol dehydrogenase oxidoreductase [Mycena olivaceomarginata]|nr:putative toluenesulfonate zinc-independent alcohol dehydrogenase oxidoreductase [Mycena olivaceomarginata]
MDKVALVTGGAAGFGLAITEKLLAQEYRVLVLDISVPADTQSTDGNKIVLRGDVTQQTHWARAVSTVLEKWGRLDVVVNNAGINMTGKDTHTVDEAFFDRLININLKSVYHSITACAPVMLKQKSGVFIHVSSVGALRPKPKIAYYCATKAAIIAISKSIAIEYAPYVRSVVIAPSMGNTGMMQLNLGPGVEATPENIAPMLANIPMGRACEPSDVASTVAFLASDDACYLTGNVVEVDGGRHI